MMPRQPNQSKEARIKRERKRLALLYEEAPKNKRDLISGLLDDAAFMRITLDDLKCSINSAGCSEEYRNGATQFGQKVSAEMSAYNTLAKNYTAVIDRLEKLLPPEKAGGKLEALMGE